MKQPLNKTNIHTYMECINMFNRLHNTFFTMLSNELEEIENTSIPFPLSLIIYELGFSSRKISATELISNPRIQSRNLTYSFKKLDKFGLIQCENHAEDKRIYLLSLTEKGKIAFKCIQDNINRHIEDIGNDLYVMSDLLKKMNTSYGKYINKQ